jgi:site-specific DNA recombinase
MFAFCEEQARQGNPIECIVCWHANRFSRADSLETSAFLFRFREAGVTRMLTKAKWIDFNRSEDRMIFGLEQEANSHRYVKDLGEAVLRGRKALARKGLWCGGPPPYGYQVEGQKLVPHPVDAETVRWVFESYANQDGGLARLCDRLADRGIPSPKGGAWCRATLVKILQNPIYLGDMVYNRRTESPFTGSVAVGTSRGRVRNNPPADWVRVPNAHPPLVGPDVFDRVQARLTENRTRTTPQKNHPFLLVGLIRCGNCQAPMIGRTLHNGKRPRSGERTTTRYYHCSRYNAYGRRSGCQPNYVREAHLIAAVSKKLAAAYFNPTTLSVLRAEIRRQEQGGEESPHAERHLEGRIADLDRKIKTGTERFLTAPDELIESCRASLTGWQEERKKLAGELDALRTKAVASEELDARVERILARAEQFETALRSADPSLARTALREMVDRIELWFDYAAKPKRVRSAFTRGLIYVHPASQLLTDLSTATTFRTRTGR